jgi:DNA-directed RNA polymerase specialized sigma24 family protein
MPHRQSDNPAASSWPDISRSYVDEFGSIESRVNDAAGRIWPRARSFAIRVLRDDQLGQRVMMKAAAIVSRKFIELSGDITNLDGYLWRTFHRLLLEEYDKERSHIEKQTELVAETTSLERRSEQKIQDIILIHEILEYADPWTREISEYLLVGYTFEEIGAHLGQKANGIRARFSERVRRLAEDITRPIRPKKS